MNAPAVFAAIVALTSSACCNVNEGRVIAKGAHLGAPAVHTSAGINSPLEAGRDPLFRAPLPDVHWITVEGTDRQGHTVQCDVILFRHDWQKVSVGDCWSKDGGASSGKECKPPTYKAALPDLRGERYAIWRTERDAVLRSERDAAGQRPAQRQLVRPLQTSAGGQALGNAAHGHGKLSQQVSEKVGSRLALHVGA